MSLFLLSLFFALSLSLIHSRAKLLTNQSRTIHHHYHHQQPYHHQFHHHHDHKPKFTWQPIAVCQLCSLLLIPTTFNIHHSILTFSHSLTFWHKPVRLNVYKNDHESFDYTNPALGERTHFTFHFSFHWWKLRFTKLALTKRDNTAALACDTFLICISYLYMMTDTEK